MVTKTIGHTEPMALVSYKSIILVSCIAVVMDILQAGKECNSLPYPEQLMTTVDFIIALFSQVDNHLYNLPKHPQATFALREVRIFPPDREGYRRAAPVQRAPRELRCLRERC
jgi:hypothetical protein